MPIRSAEARDLDQVRVINEGVVPAVNSLSAADLEWFLDYAHWFRVAERDQSIAAFMIGLYEGSDYASDNYRWFNARHKRFAYVDRIAVDPALRRSGLATALYQDFLRGMPDDIGVLTCEVNLRPPNPGSLVFHERLGFEEAGRQETEGGKKEVALLEKPLGQSK